ncbi:hypothetical protein, partial [Mesobacillus campisalis]|uniref:hypothetical protein n=1 Tax=Mesobacillus campisalis TaxID=1408103 RepID=UPI0019D33EA8
MDDRLLLNLRFQGLHQGDGRPFIAQSQFSGPPSGRWTTVYCSISGFRASIRAMDDRLLLNLNFPGLHQGDGRPFSSQSPFFGP